jgi:hypothetical protein
MSVSNHCVVSPIAVVVSKHSFEVENLRVDSCLFVGLTCSGHDGVLVRIERATRKRPGATTVYPTGAKLQ